MISQPLFFAPTGHVKVAGYKLPTNPKFWQSEIIRYLKSQHPYLPLEESEIDLRRLDANKGSAVGSVILASEIAIPIIIQRPRPGADPELSPMDVFFHKGQYRFLDPEAIKQLTHKPQIGEPEKGKDSRAVGGNPYVGDMTGDATPLEYSGQASPFAGPFDGAKMSMDLSHELLPEWMLKEAAESLREKMREKATTFGITGAVGGGVGGALRGKGGLKKRLISAAKGAAVGGASGAAGGAALPVVRKGLGIEKKEKSEQAKNIRKVLYREIEKAGALDFSVGMDMVVEGGHLAHMSKSAYLNPNDVSNFRQLLAANPHALQGNANNLKLIEIVAKRGPMTTMATGSTVKNPNIMQVYKKPDGSVCIKFSGGPETKTTPAELKDVLGDRFTEVMSKLRSGNVHMEHDGVQQASWDAVRPMSEAKAVTRDGLYAVRTSAGESVVGMVVKAVMDLDGKTLPMQLFVTPDGKYAITGEMYGVRLADKHRLPSQIPHSGQTGVFVNYVHGTPISTLPMRLNGVRSFKPVDGDKRVVYTMTNPVTGEKFSVCPVSGVQGFERMSVVDPGVKSIAEGGQIYYMPGDSEWVSLREPVKVAESADQLAKIASIPEDVTHVYYSAGMWHVEADFSKEAFVGGALRSAGKAISGAAGRIGGGASKGLNQIGGAMRSPGSLKKGVTKAYRGAGGGMKGVGAVANKYKAGLGVAGAGGLASYGAAKGVGSMMGGNKQASWENMNEPEARELLVGMGMDQDSAQVVIDEARDRQGIERGVKLAGLHEPQIQGHEIIRHEPEQYSQETIDFVSSCRPGLEIIKAAAESGHPETLDSILSLEFITPQNLRYFVDNIPDFEEAATRLAALLIGVRLGMPHVPEQPVKDALEGLSRTLNKLNILKSAMDHKNERAANSET